MIRPAVVVLRIAAGDDANSSSDPVVPTTRPASAVQPAPTAGQPASAQPKPLPGPEYAPLRFNADFHGTFNQLFPLGHTHLGYLDRVGRRFPEGHRNIQEPGPVLHHVYVPFLTASKTPAPWCGRVSATSPRPDERLRLPESSRLFARSARHAGSLSCRCRPCPHPPRARGARRSCGRCG